MAAIDVFVDTGVICHEQGHLPIALELLAARLDYAGAGQLLTQLCALEFTAPADERPKADPRPTPVPKPPPPPRPK